MPGEFWYPLLALTAALSIPVLMLALAGPFGAWAKPVVAREAAVISAINGTLGRIAGWLVLVMVLVQFSVVVMRYVFGVNLIAMQETVIYAHATLFMVGSAFTLLMDGHVRVDIFYHEASARRKAWINLLGTFLFLVPFMLIILNYSWDYVATAWRIHEGSRETSGLPYLYILKAVILVFAGMMLAQGIAEAGKAALTLRGEEPRS